MNYEETLEYLFSRLPMFSRIGAAAYKNNLDNTIRLCSFLGNPEKKITCIHVAGTNGKGSVSNMLAAIFQEAGYKTGLYTSPHIHDFRERFRVNGKMLDKDFVIAFVARLQKLTEEIQPSFFELTVAMAFEYFAAQATDIAIIETGLGGRLDSTNVIVPILAVITNIGYDHTQFLGDTIEKIAFEKAGIIKNRTPVVIGKTGADAMNVFKECAAEMQAPLNQAEMHFMLHTANNQGSYLKLSVENLQTRSLEEYESGLRGLYQGENLLTVLACVEELRDLDFRLPVNDVKSGLKNVCQITGFSGRWQVANRNPDLILDVGHNEDGIRMIISQLGAEYPGRQYHFVLGFVKDKDITAVLKLLPQDAKYYFTQAQIPRALPAQELAQQALEMHLHGGVYPEVNCAISQAIENASPDDVVIVCGSFFIISEIKKDFYSSEKNDFTNRTGRKKGL